jgi:catechol-2,3-dioxygenase
MHHNTHTLETGHVGLNVSSLPRSIAFYREALALELMNESSAPGREFAFLGRNGKLLLTLWQQSSGDFDSHRPGLHHLSFQVADMAQVQAAERRLRALQAPMLYDGIVPHAEGVSSGGIFFTDPDGIRLEIYAASGAETHAAPTPGAPSCGFF